MCLNCKNEEYEQEIIECEFCEQEVELNEFIINVGETGWRYFVCLSCEELLDEKITEFIESLNYRKISEF